MRDLIGSVNVLGDQLDELRRVIKRSERLALLGQLSGGLAHQLRNSVTGRGWPCNFTSGIAARSIRTAWPWHCGN